jgi:hypothetical protein
LFAVDEMILDKTVDNDDDEESDDESAIVQPDDDGEANELTETQKQRIKSDLKVTSFFFMFVLAF